MKLRRFTALLLAAFVGLLGQRADASRTPLPSFSDTLASSVIEAPADTVAATDELTQTPADAWLIEAVYPIGTADDGDCIELAVLVEPETHTRVWCYVKSPLGLEVNERIVGKKIDDAGVPWVQVQDWEWKWYWMGGRNSAKPISDAVWRKAVGTDLNHFVNEGGAWRHSEYVYPTAALAEETKDMERNSYQMYACVAGSGAIGGSVAAAPVVVPIVKGAYQSAGIYTSVKGGYYLKRALGPLAAAGQWVKSRLSRGQQPIPQVPSNPITSPRIGVWNARTGKMVEDVLEGGKWEGHIEAATKQGWDLMTSQGYNIIPKEGGGYWVWPSASLGTSMQSLEKVLPKIAEHYGVAVETVKIWVSQ